MLRAQQNRQEHANTYLTRHKTLFAILTGVISLYWLRTMRYYRHPLSALYIFMLTSLGRTNRNHTVIGETIRAVRCCCCKRREAVCAISSFTGINNRLISQLSPCCSVTIRRSIDGEDENAQTTANRNSGAAFVLPYQYLFFFSNSRGGATNFVVQVLCVESGGKFKF